MSTGALDGLRSELALVRAQFDRLARRKAEASGKLSAANAEYEAAALQLLAAEARADKIQRAIDDLFPAS